MLLNCGVGEDSWESLGLQPVHPKGDQSWMFIGRTDAEAETPILWPPDAKSWLIWKDPAAGKDWGQEAKGTTEDEMVRCHHKLDGHGWHGFGWTPAVGGGQGGLACYSSWGRRESDTTEDLNWAELNVGFYSLQVLRLDHVFLENTLDLTLAKKPFLSFCVMWQLDRWRCCKGDTDIEPSESWFLCI